MELDLGSNVIQNTNGVLLADGRQQMELEVREDGQALLTMEVYDSGGQRIATLRRNAWVDNEADRFTITTNPDSLRLIDTETDKIVVEVNVINRTQLLVPRGHFFTPGGVEIVVTPDNLKIGDSSIAHNLLDANNQAFVIQGGYLGIGA